MLDREGVGENDMIGILLSDLLFVLAVTGMDSAHDGPSSMPDKLRMLREKLRKRMEVLGPLEMVWDQCPDTRAAYTNGQGGLLRAALEGLEALVRDWLE
jgi:hypothetical protein